MELVPGRRLRRLCCVGICGHAFCPTGPVPRHRVLCAGAGRRPHAELWAGWGCRSGVSLGGSRGRVWEAWVGGSGCGLG